MLLFRRSRPVMTAVFVATLCVAAVSASHSWGGYHWARTSNPFTIKLGDNVNAAWDFYLGQASSDWSVSDVLDTTIVAGGTRPKNCRPTAGRVEVCNASYGNNGWLGVAQIWLSGGTHIAQGIVKLNDTYFNSATYNTPAWRALVACQEIGHTFGLDHQDENFNNANLGTCMDYTNNPASNQHPNAHDYAELDLIYAHVDSTTTIGQVTNLPNAMTDVDFAAPHQWGRLMKQQGRTAIYELDFGGGRKIVTFVIWADGEARGQR